MKQNNFSKKRMIHIYIISLLLVILLIAIGMIMLRYNVEGEKNLPFIIGKIIFISTGESNIKQEENEKWHAEILQKNDIFLTIEKNENYKKVDTIKEIRLENIKIEKQNDDLSISVYRPKSNAFDYTYSEDYKVNDSIVFTGSQETSMEAMQINNQGGRIGLSTIINNLTEYDFEINEKVPSDGKLLSKAGIKLDDIKFTLSYDLIIETGSGNKFKAHITHELPTGDIMEKGVSFVEIPNTDEIVFKRI